MPWRSRKTVGEAEIWIGIGAAAGVAIGAALVLALVRVM